MKINGVKQSIKNPKRNPWIITQLILLHLLACGSIWGQTDILDFADLLVEEIEPNDPNQPQPLPFIPGGAVQAIGLEGDLSDQFDTDAFGFNLPFDLDIDLIMDLAPGSDTEILALDIGPDNKEYFVTASGLWQHNSATAQRLATTGQIAQAIGLTADDVEISDIAIIPDPNDFRILVILAGRGDIVSVDLMGNVVWELDSAAITDLTGQSTADLVGIDIIITEETIFPEAPNENPIVLLETSMGDIELELFPEDAPIHVENFIAYIETSFYEGLIFHRVDNSSPSFWVIQAAAFDANMNPPDPNTLFDPIVNESLNGLSNLQGTLGMARTSDPDSAKAQFYINVADNQVFDPENQGGIGFTVFGEVSNGMDVVDAISQVAVTGTVPDVPVVIESVSVVDVPPPAEIVNVITLILADQTSGAILQTPLDFSDLTTYTANETISDNLLESFINGEFESGTSTLPTTVVAQTTETFGGVNALVHIPQGHIYPEGFYVSQLGSNFNGDGAVTHIVPDANDATQAVFTPLFEPDETQILEQNPSALAWDSRGDFENKLFMGNFGASLGDDFDGEVLIVEPNGLIRPFVTEMLDLQGDPVDGFFDVTDMAFSDGGDFGTYLYVISENIDNNGPDTNGGFQSDLWRIDPAGRAEIFVPDIADGAITLAFGGADYDGDLFVGLFSSGQSSTDILRVDSSGNVETFISLDLVGSGFAASDIVSSPNDSIFQGHLLITTKGSSQTFVAELAPDLASPDAPPIWASGLQTGDISSGDLVFDPNGNLFILEQAANRLTRLDVDALGDYILEDIQIRSDSLEAFEPFVLLNALGQNRLLALGNPQEEDLINAVEVSTLNPSSGNSNDQSNPVVFTFDDQGDLFLFVQNNGDFQSGSRDATESSFSSLTMLLANSHMEINSELSDMEWSHLVWAPDGHLTAIAQNGPDSGLDPNSLEKLLDNQLLSLGNTIEPRFIAGTLLTVMDQTTLSVTLDGPESHNFELTLTDSLDETLEAVTSGSYNLVIEPTGLFGLNYTFLLALGAQFERELDISDATIPQTLTTIDDEQFQWRLSGAGQASLIFDQQPGSGKIVSIQSLSLTNTRSNTIMKLTDPLGEESEIDIHLDEIILDGSLKQLIFPGQVDVINVVDPNDARGTIKELRLGDLRAMNAPDFSVRVLEVDNLGDPNSEEQSEIILKGIGNLFVSGDISNIQILNRGSLNIYKNISVDGVIQDTTIFGRILKRLVVNNNLNGQPQTSAINSVTFGFNERGGQLSHALIKNGNISDASFSFGKRIVRLEISNGNMENTTLVSTLIRGQIYSVLVKRRSDDPNNNQNAGNIIESEFIAFKKISRIHADGEISGNTSIRTIAPFPSPTTINRITSGGNNNATIRAFSVNRIHAGFNQLDKRIPDSHADFTGTVNATSRIKEISATGAISNATLQTSISNITNIFAEDGFINSSASANSITRIMVGYRKGNRKFIVNEQADASGTINANKLGRIYSTGSQQGINLTNVTHIGPLVENDTGF
jgi:cyclophilin family peptidyl-prolyl cis-trans isomerase